AQACHHDNFDNWDSKHNPWNAVRVGPQKNIVRLWQEAARARGLYFGVTEHLGATFNWFAVNKGCDKTGRYAGVPYDGNDPEYESLYLPNRGETRECWYTANEWWHEHWFKRILDLIDQHKPDLLYSDGPLPFNIPGKGLTRPEAGLAIVAHLYNTSIREHGENRAVYNQKDTNPDVFRIGVLDIERGGMQECPDHTWQTDTCVGGWFYNFQHKYKTPKHVIEMLIDIVSKNGNLLLNIPQRPDGSHDEECLYLLDEMAAWIAVNGEGIYGTRPWRVCEEGPTRSNESGAFKESELTWTSKDFRFTSKNGDVYAFIMQWPEDGLVFIRSLANGPNPPAGRVSLLGHNEPLEFTQNEYGLGVRLPERAPSRYMCCLKVEFES
ncbi:MAG: alpha-L-fucosidase, partial [Lentisphaerae bacterium]